MPVLSYVMPVLMPYLIAPLNPLNALRGPTYALAFKPYTLAPCLPASLCAPRMPRTPCAARWRRTPR